MRHFKGVQSVWKLYESKCLSRKKFKNNSYDVSRIKKMNDKKHQSPIWITLNYLKYKRNPTDL